MRSSTFKVSVLALAVFGLGASSAVQAAGLTGNIGVASKYVLRGITNAPEHDGPAVQGGLDYSTEGGFYAGYWFSTLGYSAKEMKDGPNSTEHDIYAGYNGKIGSKFNYTAGLTYYYYDRGWNTNAPETKLGFSIDTFSFTSQTLLHDVTWGNAGDTYLLSSYSHALPKDFTIKADLGLYLYKKDGEFFAETADSQGFGFRHLTVGVTHPLGATGGTMGLSYIIGGYDRYDVKQKNQLVGTLGFTF